MNPLYRIVIYPIELILEFFFSFFDKSFGNYGIAVLGIGFVVSFLTLPLYHVAESLQKKERDHRIALAPGIERIKTTFKGDEQYMMLSTFYRQNNYHPLYALRSSVSLAIQVPFFIAAYHFLSNLEQLRGVSFYGIPDLGAPDGMLKIFGTAINALPILMTVINIFAGIVYTKGFPLKDKIQLYGMAGLFLILLYNSPAGLVLYWTLNNIFSLVKNLFYKLKHPLPMLYVLSLFGAIGLSLTIYMLHPAMAWRDRAVFITGCVFIASLPLLVKATKVLYDRLLSGIHENKRLRLLVLISSLMVLFLVHGLLIPANLIASSTIEFSFNGSVTNPLTYVGRNLMVFFGLWIIWPLFLYALSNETIKDLFIVIFSFLAITALANLFFFTGEYGTISILLQLDRPALLEATPILTYLPFLVALLVLIVILALIKSRRIRVLSSLLIILALGTFLSGGYQAVVIQREFKEYGRSLELLGDSSDSEIQPSFHLSKSGKNVLFIFLDRAMSSFFPYILEDLPDLRQQLEGFVYYPNTVSHGSMTLLGSPAMMGGYEYSPDAINERQDEALVDKHNEALLVMPRMFLNSGYSVTVTNPPFSNYKGNADFAPFLEYPEIQVLNHQEKFILPYYNEHPDDMSWTPGLESNLLQNRLPVFSIMKTSFPVLRHTLYEGGRYFQRTENPFISSSFLGSYAQLYYLQELTDFIDRDNSFVLICNETTHSPTWLQSPEYEPRSQVTNTATPLDGIGGIREYDQTHYQVNAASLKQLGRYFDFLREEGVYDNTRIVIVADHGADLYSDGMSDFSQNERVYNRFVPLFLSKDFHAKGPIVTDETFMTNADAPLFALEGLVDAVNPFTGNNIFNQVKKDVVNVYTGPYDPRYHKRNVYTYDPTASFSVKDDIFKEENWMPLMQQERK